MILKWLGHACFLITSGDGLKIITDPYLNGGKIRYAPVDDSADIVTISHDHYDHNALSAVSGNPEVIRGRGLKIAKGIQFKGIPTYHDESKGEQRGDNTVFCYSIDGIKVCHLGDLGHRLSHEQINEIGDIDLLLIPVGGFYTIDANVATQVCDDLNPKVIVPMHYKTPKLDFPITGVDEFLKGKRNVKRLDLSEAEFVMGKLPDISEIIVLKSDR